MCEYISLGTDCSVAYNLQKLSHRKCAYPFDWIKLNKFEDLIDILETNFKYFLDTEYLKITDKSDKFPFINDDWNDELSNNIIIKHTKYSINFPHEIKDIDINNDFNKFIEKYQRRIDRFNFVLKDKSIKKIFIRITYKNENKKRLEETLSKICNNYIVRYIQIDKKTKFSSWKKEELNWIDYTAESK